MDSTLPRGKLYKEIWATKNKTKIDMSEARLKKWRTGMWHSTLYCTNVQYTIAYVAVMSQSVAVLPSSSAGGNH